MNNLHPIFQHICETHGLIAKDDAECAPSTGHINAVASDLATVERIREMFRSDMLAMLSQARALSLSMDARVREQLLDNLTRHFNPDGTAADLFSDGFTATIEGLENELSEYER